MNQTTKQMKKYSKAGLCLLIASLLMISAVFAGCSAASEVEADSPEYVAALALLENGQYKEAIEAFTALGDYKDSQDKVLTALHNRAHEMVEKGTYDPASVVLLKLLNASREMALREEEIAGEIYTVAQKMMEEGKYSPAKKLFEALGDFEDSSVFFHYAETHMALDRGAYAEALEGFQALGDFLDTQELIPAIEQIMEEKGLN